MIKVDENLLLINSFNLGKLCSVEYIRKLFLESFIFWYSVKLVRLVNLSKFAIRIWSFFCAILSTDSGFNFANIALKSSSVLNFAAYWNSLSLWYDIVLRVCQNSWFHLRLTRLTLKNMQKLGIYIICGALFDCRILQFIK